MLIRVLDWESQSDRTLPGAAPPGYLRQWCCDKSATTVTSPTRSGQYAARFQLDRDDAVVSSSKRTEISEPVPSATAPERQERWIGFSIHLPADWTADPSAESVTQWHQVADTGGPPPLGLITNNGQWQISQHWENHEHHTLLGPYVTGRWTDWVFHIRWAPDAQGSVTAWRDGAEVFSTTGKNKYADGRAVYMKFGIYKWDWQSNPQKSNTNRRVLYYDSLRIADQSGSYRDVDPANVTPQAVVLRPREDVASWTVHGAATAFAAIDDAVTQPAPVDSSDYIWAGGVGRVTEVSVGRTSTGSSSTAQAWFYANTGRDTRLKVEVLAGAEVLGRLVVDPGEPFRWRSIGVPVANLRPLDDLRLRFTSVDGPDSNIRAAYLAVTQ